MIKLSILYPNARSAQFDLSYYCEKHIPMFLAEMGTACKGVCIDYGIEDEKIGGNPAYLVMGHFLFDSLDALQAVIQACGDMVKQDVVNFTNITPVVQISGVKIYQHNYTV